MVCRAVSFLQAQTGARHAPRSGLNDRMVGRYLPPFVLIAGLIVSWEVLVWWLALPAWLLPPPSRIATALVESLPLLREHVAATMVVTAIGFALALLLGFALALLIDASPLLRRALYPLLIASQTIPIVAVAPLLVVGLGFGMLPKVLVVVLVTFFPIVVNVVDGLQATDREMVRLLQAMDASHWQLLRLLRIPAALPAMFTGIKIAVTYSVIGAVLAEWIGASAGLGVYIARSLRAFRTDQVFVAALITSLLTVTLFVVTTACERWLVFWKERD
jgi:ABC-type nitrate/sulfonate/bicarbonate transport system permease component